MTLNGAIRKGILHWPNQSFNNFFNKDILGACVVGAALQGLDLDKGTKFSVFLRFFPELSEQFTCPMCKQIYTTVGLMMHLNDGHDQQWTREAIAELIDPQPELHVSLPKQTELIGKS